MAAKDLVITTDIRISSDDLTLQFSRSSGAGGQNVNKVNSRAELRFNLRDCTSLSEDVKSRLFAEFGRRITQDGVLVVSSQRFRDQSKNIEDCYSKLRAWIEEALYEDPERKPTRPSWGSVQRRLNEKRQRSRIKDVRRRYDDG